MNFKELYHDEMTTQSFKELVNFTKWLNKLRGHHPTILGGWAVFFYVKGLGSRDIDVLFPSPRVKHSAVNEYFAHNGYTMNKKDAFSIEFFKEIKRLMNPGAILTTYSCARIVRDNMKAVGLTVEDGPVLGRRGPATIATLK